MYPYVETLKVGAAYAALLYIWPGIVLRGLLRDKGLAFRFIFCSIVPPLLLSTLVLTLGLFHILNVWIVRLLFWGALIVSLLGSLWRWRRQGGASARLPLRALITGSYGWKLFFFRAAEVPARRLKRIWRDRKRYAEYLVLAAVLLFGMAFFLNGAFHEYSFGCQELYTHYEWTSALLHGEIFPAGVYPEGMNCFLYALHTLFGVKLYSCVLFLAGIHNSTAFLLASYCLFKELFHSRHTALFVLAAWLTFDGIGAAAQQSTARMAWMLPQEFALYLVFLCPLLLLRYFREDDRPGKWYRDENLLLLMAGTAYAASTHFNVLVMVLFSCCAVSAVHYRQLRPAKRLLAPLGAVLYGIELGVLPMLAACAMGKDLESSLLWGINSLHLKLLHESGYVRLYAKTLAAFLILALLLVCAAAAAHEYERRRGQVRKRALPAGAVYGYLSLAAALAVFAFLYAMPRMGLSEPVAADGMRAVIRMLAIGAAGILADGLILWAEHLRGKTLPRRWMALGCLGIYLLANAAGFHQCTYWYLHRYNSAVTLTDQIMNSYPEWNYRIVSMWDEAYQAGWGSHEELITFLENTGKKNYTIPVEYIFLYVEKHPLRHGQKHFLTAPRWLARDNEAYEGLENESICPDILHAELTDGLAQEPTHYYPNVLDNYEDLAVRTTLSAKLYRWCQDFSTLHPAETNVYFEDDDFICYVIHQDPKAPLKLTSGGGSGI